jgi:predicted MFS family arabinose efflux permease
MPTADSVTPPLLSRPLLLYFIVAFGSMTCFYLLLSVVPLYATAVGAGRVGAGMTTAVLMLATVAAELATPALVARLGYRVVLGAGLVLLGAPVLGLIGTRSLTIILAVSVVRGVGLAILVVAGSALVATLVPRERRSEGIGLLGVVAGIPAVLALPLGVWLSGRAGFSPVFIAAAVAALVPVVALPALPGRRADGAPAVGMLTGLRSAGQVRPAMLFLLTALSAGIVVTFLPLATAGASGGTAPVALFVHAVATTAARWWSGRHGDRHGQTRLLILGVVACAAGMAILAIGTGAAPVMAGAILLGLGFGAAQNASLSLMFERVPASGYDMVSAMYNLAYDAGMGLGAATFGVLAARTGYAGAFLAVGLLLVLALVPLWRDRAWLAAR